MTIGFSCETLHQFWCKCLRWLHDWLRTTIGFRCETLHQFWYETFSVIAWLTTYDYWLLLGNFAPVLVWNFYGDCLNDYERPLAFAAKLLRWLSFGILLSFFAKEKMSEYDHNRDDKLLLVQNNLLQEHVVILA